MLSLASHWPMSTDFSRGLPSTRPARKPPAKASPAPLVSLICSLAIAWTGTSLISASPWVARSVGSVPWVMMTTRLRCEFSLGRSAMWRATSLGVSEGSE